MSEWGLKLYCCAHDLQDLYEYLKKNPFPSPIKVVELFRLEESALSLEWVPIDNEDVLHVTDVLRVDVEVQPGDDPEEIAAATETLELIDLDHLALSQAELRALEVQDHLDQVDGDVNRLTVNPESLQKTLTSLCNFALGKKSVAATPNTQVDEEEVSQSSLEKVLTYEADEYPTEEADAFFEVEESEGQFVDVASDEAQYRAHLQQQEPLPAVRIINTQ